MSLTNFRRYLLASGALVSLWTALATPSHAADGSAMARPGTAAVVGEVVVTAERRSENIQATPLAITAVTATALDNANAQDITALAQLVPSLTITKTGGRETVPTIRGIGSATPENSGTTGPGVSLFQDGAYIGDSVSAGEDLFDIDHVEVLRGPQGTLYGVSSTGGAIIIVSRPPKLGQFEAYGDFSAGNYNYFRERGAMNIPLGNQFALRISGQKLDHHGFATNTVTGQDLDDAHTGDIKASLLWQPTQDFSATLTGQWFSQKDHGAEQKGVNDTNPDPRVESQDFLQKNNMDSAFVHLNLRWELPWFTVSSVASYRRYHSSAAENVTFTTFKQYQPYEDVPRFDTGDKSFTEELDLLSLNSSKFKWDAGIFLMRRTTLGEVLEYQGNSLSDALPTYVDTSLPAAQLPQNLSFGDTVVDVRTVVEPFLQLTYPILDNLHLTVGGRYNYESHKATFHNFSKFANVTLPTLTDSTKTPTWRAQLDWNVTPLNLLYASVSTGYKAGGINGSTSDIVVPRIFKPEHNTAFEIGSKNSVFDQHLRANFAAFYYVYRDMQYIETDPIPFGQGMSNIPSVHIWGGEGELTYNGLANHLHLSGSLALEHGKVEGFTPTLYPTIVNAVYGQPVCAFGGQFYNPKCWAAVVAASKNIAGSTPPHMPTVTTSLIAAYDFDLAGGVLTPDLEFSYRGSEFASIFNEPGVDRIKSYGLLNINATYIPPGGHLRIILSATNLADKAAVNSRYTSPYESGLTSLEYVPPRQIVGTVAYKF